MIKEIVDFIKTEAERFGAKSEANNKDFVFRDNTKKEALDDNGAYFGFISPEEELAGVFHDFSLTIFPTDTELPWVVCLGVGSGGFKNDYDLAATPGVRRLFSTFVSDNGFCKTKFSDIETNLPKSFTNKVPHLKKTLQQYSSVLPVCEIVNNPTSDDGKKIISAFVAGYAKIRNWANNQTQRKAIDDSISAIKKTNYTNVEAETYSLLLQRKYLVLEGPPGTGKTRLANLMGAKLNAKTFFTQFHPEVSYSDFVEGIRPNLKSDKLLYEQRKGILLQALEYAIQHEKENVVLIIDEINRANLSSVLGPLFYLLEFNRNYSGPVFTFPNGDTMEQFPTNFYLIGTMNTADRSLAVVDFALRRRFAWYKLLPIRIDSKTFFREDFDRFDLAFNWYADSQEINFQPGQAYFIAKDEDEMKNRIRFELLPLIKEYLSEGILLRAKEELNSYFVSRIGQSIFE
jgi:5-methylcytosine-specific restriction protein B